MHKTAYELRISDWSSDVCSSDLSCRATCTPIEALVAPGPRVANAIPGRPVIVPSAHAMKPTPPSCRHTTRSIAGVSWSASSTARKLSPGTVKMRSHPCATRLSTRMRPPVRVFTRLLPVAFHNVIRSEEHTSELQSLMRISYAVFCLKKKNNQISYTQQKST